MPAAKESPASDPNAAYDLNDTYDASAMARELMMPAGESAAAVIGACLLLGMIWLVGSGHFAGASNGLHAAAAERSNPRQSLDANGGAIPMLHRSAS